MPPPVVAVVGATATGKSDLAVALALELGGEVVNADSMQLYRGMDVGTAKLPVAERRGVPHHLLDVLDVRQTAAVGAFQRAARAVVDDAVERGVVPVLVGGSALYVRAVLDRLEFPGTDPDLRERLESELAEVGAVALHARLAVRDPAAAAAILPTNGRRIVRALEVGELRGGPFTARLPEPLEPAYVDAVVIGVRVPRDVLAARIERRVERMREQDLVGEVRRLERAGLREGRTAPRAIGYAQVLRHLDGELAEADVWPDTARATRRFARRQASWFDRDPRVRWLDPRAGDVVESALRAIREQQRRPVGGTEAREA